MNKALDELDQFMYLMENDEFHPESTPTEMMNMIKEEHELYLGTMEQRLAYYADLVDQKYHRDVAKRYAKKYAKQAKQEGLKQGLEQGLEQGMQKGMQKGMKRGVQQGQREQALKQVHKLILKVYETNIYEKLEQCSYEQLDTIYDLCLENAPLHEIMMIIENNS